MLVLKEEVPGEIHVARLVLTVAGHTPTMLHKLVATHRSRLPDIRDGRHGSHLNLVGWCVLVAAEEQRLLINTHTVLPVDEELNGDRLIMEVLSPSLVIDKFLILPAIAGQPLNYEITTVPEATNVPLKAQAPPAVQASNQGEIDAARKGLLTLGFHQKEVDRNLPECRALIADDIVMEYLQRYS